MPQFMQWLALLAPLLVIALKVGIVVGGTGSLLEAIGSWRNWPKLVAFGQKLEALGADIPKLVSTVEKFLPPPSASSYAPERSRMFPVDSKPPSFPPAAALIGRTLTPDGLVRSTLLLGCLCACLFLGGCANWKPVAKSVDQAAIILCDVFFGEQPKNLSLSPADVERAFCSSAEQVAPFLDSAKKAMGRGGAIRLAVEAAPAK